MSARTKLNGIYLTGILLFAGLLGVGFSSWLVFAIVLVAGAALLILAGEIRLAPSAAANTLRARRSRR